MFQNLYFKYLNTEKYHNLKLQCIRVQMLNEPDQKWLPGTRRQLELYQGISLL